MHGRLVETTTDDGIKLHGFLSSPSASKKVWIVVHGVNSNFYSSSLLREIASGLASPECSVLLVNTRGHDLLSFNTGEIPLRLGSQMEILSSCVHDLDAWARLCAEHGFEQVSLLGHSLGALKCCLWASSKSHDVGELEKLVAVSPPRLNTLLLLNDPVRGEAFSKYLEDARAHCDSGRPEHVMKVRFPLPMWICAATYLDKYGSGDKYDYVKIAEQLSVHCLWTFGSVEVEAGSANFRNAQVALAKAIGEVGAADLQKISIVSNADHSYRGVRQDLLSQIKDWEGGLPANAPSA